MAVDPNQQRTIDPNELLLPHSVTPDLAWVPTVYAVGATGAPGFQNAWVNSGGALAVASYYVLASGEIALRGSVKNGTINTIIFTLPLNYRPSAELRWEVYNGAAACGVSVAANGDVSQINGAGVGIVSLDAVRFYPA